VAGGRAEAIHNHDLNGIRLLDMPWLIEPDHPAVMVYARPPQPLAAELERLYALGIDAARLAELLLERPLGPALSVDGVSGRLTLERGNVIARDPSPARIVNGLPVLDRR
jgi:outer membrane PBP1 activator LpoA protein